MGSSESKSPSLEYDTPWRKMGEKHTLQEKLRNFTLDNPEIKFVRILVAGEVGAGKSSFINSINNAFQDRITSGALVDATAGTSFTKVYKTHYIREKDGKNLPFVFNNIMGLENGDNQGVQVQDIVTAFNGLLKEGYKFNPVNPASKNDSTYKNNPNVSDQIFCLVYIIAANNVSLIDVKIINKMKQIREAASELNLPQVIIMTKVDEACPLVKNDITKVYTSKKIKEKMETCKDLLGVPMSHIFPVKNYHEEIDTVNDLDVLILKALEQIVNIAREALRDQKSHENVK
ncbi:interferon-induced protein 44-like [Clarias gariepinus]|uniref:interferon-induced protein 44-like n=1 Tax=Clarias gariepinus TaxID=13013 RepID=UPI00234C1373|nr:interferon-induced protein 44-like [Clarias gariepinus]